MRLLLGDCIDKLKELDDNSIDSIVTDPPYGLSFMGKDWDKKKATQETKSQVVKGLGAGMKMTTLADNIEFEKWVTEWASECMRVLKPGGYMLAFGGSRMYHRLASGVENAGFEIRDQMMWIYGSGFPKSMDISKAIDKAAGAEREVISEIKTNSGGMAHISKTNAEHGFRPTAYTGSSNDKSAKNVIKITAPATDEAKKWEGWGTALKPAHEPIVMARKPLSEKTVVDNVLEWGTGGINIDESRIQHDEPVKTTTRTEKGDTWNEKNSGLRNNPSNMASADPSGRFPANIIFDEEAGKILDEQSGHLKSGFMKAGTNRKMSSNPNVNTYGYFDSDTTYNDTYGDSGGASRFFYCPKTSKTDRNEGLEHLEDKLTQGMRANAGPALVGDDESGRTTAKNNHPTVKPTDLMLYLIRLVTPKGGTTLDPFMGSGSTGKAAVRGGFDFVGIEREEDYMEIATARIQYEQDNPYNEEKEERIELNKNSQKFW